MRRIVRRIVAIPRIEQLVRWTGVRRHVGQRAMIPPGALVTSSGRGTISRVDLPAPGTRAFRGLVRSANRSQLLVVRPRQVDPTVAGALRALAMRGIPTWVDVAPQLSSEVPIDDALWRALTEPPATDDDDLARYVRSVRLARAMCTLAARRPTVSVLLATRRPTMIDHAIAAIVAQRDVELQLVVGLHGKEWSDGVERRLASAWSGDLVTLRHDAKTTLGTVLDSLAARADGDLVTKWDDDDWYGPHHVADLVQAHSSSRAQLVGKAAEFVWLESTDETIRRPAVGARTFSDNLAGGTLLMARSDLAQVGGFPNVPKAVDRVLIDRVNTHDGRVYRTHGLEFLLRRTSTGQHTWDVGTEYFTSDAVARRSGLDLEFADIPRAVPGAGPT